MIVREARYSAFPPWLGRRVVTVYIEPDEVIDASSIAETVKAIRAVTRNPCLIDLQTREPILPEKIRDLISLLKSHAHELGYIFNADWFIEGPVPTLSEEMNELVISFESPDQFTELRRFNEAVQECWFIDGYLSIVCYCKDLPDLEASRRLYSLVPRDIPFYIIATEMGVAIRQQLADHPETFRFIDGC